MATPFTGQVFTFTQPDGSTLQVRGWGDRNYAVFETLDGYTVTENVERRLQPPTCSGSRRTSGCRRRCRLRHSHSS